MSAVRPMQPAAALDETLGARLADLVQAGLLRSDDGLRAQAAGATPRLQTWCSNDYLGLSHHPEVIAAAQAAAATYGAGATGSRLVTGSTPIHLALEQALATWLDVPAVLLFSSGYQANVGVMQALVQPGDAVFSDARNHASLIDGMRLCRGQRHVFAHNDLQNLEEALTRCDAPGLRVVVVESIYSMDGDAAPLVGLCDLCERFGAVLVVDEAHALGVRGPGGRGLVAELGLTERVPVRVGTLGKSFASAGAFVAGSEALRRWLYNRARSFVFATAPVPAACGAALAALRLVEAGAHQAALGTLTARLAQSLAAVGLLSQQPAGAIFPLHVGDPVRTVAASQALAARGYFVQAIRPPTVPPGTARLRVTVSAAHELAAVDGLVEAIAAVLGSPASV